MSQKPRFRAVAAIDPGKLAEFQSGIRKRYSDDQILAELRACAERVGKSPTMREFASDRETTVHPQTVIEHFGTWNAAKRAAGLVPRRFVGEEKSRRQMLFSTDLVYDVLRKHQADHVLLRAARADAATGLLDIRRLGEMLSRIKGRIVHKALDHVSPLAVPVMLEIGREAVYGEASDQLLAETAEELVREAMG